jgi:hypothetical protein
MADLSGMHPVAYWVLAAAMLLSALAVIYRLAVRPLTKLGLEVRELLRDLRGYPGRSGHPPRPGLLQQVLDLDAKVEEHLDWSRGFVEEYLGRAQEESTQLLATIEAVHAAEHQDHHARPPTARTRADDRKVNP